MSQSQSYERKAARRVFAREFNDGTYTFSDSDDDRAPTFQLLPTGQRANRVYFCGTVTEVEDVGTDSEYWRARVVGPTGTVLVYAGQYEPDAMAKLRKMGTPEYVAVCGKVRSYTPDDDDYEGEGNPDTIVSISPKDFLVTIDGQQRDEWVQETADKTLDRIEQASPDNPDVSKANDQYNTEAGDYTDMVVDALETLDGSEHAEGDSDSPTSEAGSYESAQDAETSDSDVSDGADQTGGDAESDSGSEESVAAES